MSQRKRLDLLLVERGLVSSREQARRLIMAGAVVAGEQRVDKPGTLIDPASVVRLKADAQPPYVSRGGHKLAGGLKAFGVDVSGVTAWMSGLQPAGLRTVFCSTAQPRSLPLMSAMDNWPGLSARTRAS